MQVLKGKFICIRKFTSVKRLTLSKYLWYLDVSDPVSVPLPSFLLLTSFFVLNSFERMEEHETQPSEKKFKKGSAVKFWHPMFHRDSTQEKLMNITQEKACRPVIDCKELMFQLGSEDVVTSMISRFQDYLPTSMNEVNSAFKKKNSVDLKHCIHSLKGAAGSIRAVKMNDILQQLHVMCRDNSIDWPNNAPELKTMTDLIQQLNECSTAILNYKYQND